MTTQQARREESGFSLVELLIATLVLVVCLVGVALMILYGTQLGAAARESTATNALAKARLERLRVLPRGAPERQAGGSLSADTADHFERLGRYTARWQVGDGPSGTQDVTLVVVAADARVPSARLRVLLR